MRNTEYESLTDLGKRFGVSSHVIGRWLAALGLRVVGKNDPTVKAIQLGLTAKAPTNRGDGCYTYTVWHVAKTVALLEAAGHKQIHQLDQQPSSLSR
jgi:hypothetical protein